MEASASCREFQMSFDAVARPVHGVGEVGGGNELRVAHGGSPGAGEAVGLHDALLQDLEGGDELLIAIVLAAARIGQRGQRADDAHRALVLAEIRFHAPDAEQDVAVDAVFLLDRGEQLFLFRLLRLARLDADGRHRLRQIVGGGGGELGLVGRELQDGGIRLGDARERGIEQRARNARRLGAGPQRILDEGLELVVGEGGPRQQRRQHDKRGETASVHVIPSSASPRGGKMQSIREAIEPPNAASIGQGTASGGVALGELSLPVRAPSRR